MEARTALSRPSVTLRYGLLSRRLLEAPSELRRGATTFMTSDAAAELATLRDAVARQERELAALRGEAQAHAAATSARLDEVLGLLRQQHETPACSPTAAGAPPPHGHHHLRHHHHRQHHSHSHGALDSLQGDASPPSEASLNDDGDVPLLPTTAYTGSTEREPSSWREWLTNPASVGLPDDHAAARCCDVVFLLVSFVTATFAVTAVDPHTTNLSPGHPLFTLFVTWFLLDGVFIKLWVATRFVVQARSGKWLVVDTLPRIRRHYMRTWFWVDLCVALPVDWVFLGWHWRWFFYLQARHLVRVVRTLFVRHRCNPLKPRRQWLTFLWQLCFMFWLLHVLATGFADIEDHTYLDALYFTVLTVTTVGYGDITAQTRPGRIYTIFLMVMGVAFVAIVTAFATSFLTWKSSVAMEEDARATYLDALLRRWRVPWPLQREIIAVLPRVLEAQQDGRDLTTLARNLPDDIRAVVDFYCQRELLHSGVRCVADVFRDPHSSALGALTRHCARLVVAEGEAIVTRGGPIDAMYIVARGSAIATTHTPGGTATDTLGIGRVFGEAAVFRDTRIGGKVPTTVRADRAAELLVLTRAAFRAFAKRHPTDATALRARYTELCDEQAFEAAAPRAAGDVRLASGGGGVAAVAQTYYVTQAVAPALRFEASVRLFDALDDANDEMEMTAVTDKSDVKKMASSGSFTPRTPRR